jgi:superfamily II DNA/RNA helicase
MTEKQTNNNQTKNGDYSYEDYDDEFYKEDYDNKVEAVAVETNTNNNTDTNTDTEVNVMDYCKISSFKDLSDPVNIGSVSISGFRDEIIRGIYSYGFEDPTYIQSLGIRAVATGKDVIGQAQSGTGKTGAFTIGLLNLIDENVNEIQGIIVVHTNEMVLQIENVIRELAKYTKIRFISCSKNTRTRDNIDALTGYKNNGLIPHIIIASPGRLVDMMNRTNNYNENIINTKTIKTLILDEADELLGTTNRSGNRRDNRKTYNNFIEQIKEILSLLPKQIQICLFSATMNKNFFEFTQKLMLNPLRILLKTTEITLEGIKQYYIDIDENNKESVILDLYKLLDISKCIIYCNSKRKVNRLHETLTMNNHICSIIHGDMEQCDRKVAMDNFRRNKSNVLISTDLIGRGIDIQQLSTVINYDIPLNIESYIHRIGRSGRHGRKGVAINLVTDYDKDQINLICEHYDTQIDELPEDIESILT